MTESVGLLTALKKYLRNDKESALSPINITQIANEISNLTQERLKRHGIQLAINTKGFENVQVLCRELEISQVLLNLVNNAIDEIRTLEDRWAKIDFSHTNDNFLEIKSYGFRKHLR